MARNPESPLLLARVYVYDVFLSVFAEKKCFPYHIFFTLRSFGNEILLNVEFDNYGATDAESEAFGKILECSRETGVEGKILTTKFLVRRYATSPCTLW